MPLVTDALTPVLEGDDAAGSSLLDSRIQRELYTERLVNTARLIGVVLGFVQFGLFTDYPAGVREVGLVIGVLYGVIAVASRRELARRTTLEAIRQLTTATLLADAVLLATTALMLAYQSDPTNLFLMVLVLLEASMKRQVRGAMWMAGAGILVEIGRVLLRAEVHALPVKPAESTFFAGMLILIALFAGGTVRLQVAAQDDLARSNDRLRAMRRLLRSGIDSFSGGTGLQQILAEAVEGLALRSAIVRPAHGAAVAWPAEATIDPVVEVLARELSLLGEQTPGPREGVDHVDGQGRVWRALSLSRGPDGEAILVMELSNQDGARQDADALQAELQAVLRASTALAVEEEMHSARERLDRLRHDVVAVTTHEIRTPVTIIKAAVESIQRGVAPTRHGELVGTIEAATVRLEGVVENLQLVQRLDSGTFATHLGRVDVGAALADVAHMVAQSPVSIDRLVDSRAWADADLVHTVLRCLVDNAVTHGLGREVRLEAFVDGELIIVDVSDAGPGVPMQARQRIFERFAAASAANHHRGAGIGLPLARELARLMDGDVDLLDVERTTFRLHLPRAD